MNFIHDLWQDLLYSHWKGRFLALSIFVLSMSVLVFIFGLLFFVADRSFLTVRYWEGTVTSKYSNFSSADTAMADESADQFRPESQKVTVMIDKDSDSISIPKSFLDTVREGEMVKVGYVSSRFTNSVKIKSISK